MSDVAIRVEGLSKVYRLGERQAGYRTLRESITDTVLRPFRKRAPSAGPDMLWALRDVSFAVKPGEVIGVIGRNGAGKSTLLKVLSGITEPTSGHADVYGRIGSLLEVGSGFHPELSGRENIFLNGAILGMRRAEIQRKFDEIVAFAEVERFVDTPVKRYSSGMYLRLAFAVAAHLEPEILVVDEVLAVGDLAFQNKCLNKMQDVSGQGRTVLFVSHNMGAIHRLCSRCLLLNQGQVVEDGPTNDVIESYVAQGLVDRPEYVQASDPSKPVNLLRAELTTESGQLATEFRWDEGVRVGVDYEVNQPVRECSVWIGVRTVEETWAFGSADTDGDVAEIPGQHEPGRYRAEVTIPGRLLNTGRYHVVVGIARLASRVSYDRVDLSSFTVLDVGIPERGRPGVFQPLLDWVTSPVGAIAEARSA